MNICRSVKFVALVLFLLLPIVTVDAQNASTYEELLEKVKLQEKRIEALEGKAQSSQAPEVEAPTKISTKKGLSFENSEETFKLQINGRLQARYTAFSPNSSKSDRRNEFEIERGRLSFAGYLGDPKLTYYINFDADTDDNHSAIFHDFWFGYQFDRALGLYAGKMQVPGSRDWRNGSTRTHFIDRSLATSFFRPDRSVGVWAKGHLAESLYYEAMLSNGAVTTDLETGQVDKNLSYSATTYWEPLEKYGMGYADLENHQKLAIRTGASFVYNPTDGVDSDDSGDAEQKFVRLSNGVRLIDEGALGEGSQVEKFDFYLLAIDFAAKLKGFSLNAEAFIRWLEDIEGTGTFTTDSVEDFGFYVDAGYMICPKRFELVTRYSLVDGDFGASDEYAGGLNYYVNGDHKNKLSFDASYIDDSPVRNSGPNYLVGDSGMMYRAQWQVAF